MEKKKKNCKFASTASQEANESNEILNKDDRNHSGLGLFATGKNATNSSSSLDNAPSLNQQFQPVVQLSQHQQPNVGTYHVQHIQPPPHLSQSAIPFWVSQRPGYQFNGVNTQASCQPFVPVGTTDISWQGPAMTGGGDSVRNQAQIPSFCYHVNYPYPGFPGPWDPTSCWGQAQPSPLPPCNYAFARACGYTSSPPPPIPVLSAFSSQSFQKGIIQPPEKLSQKHQQLWKAQSAENVQLWAVVGHLQSELADYKSRLMKIESEVFSLKLTVEEPTNLGTGTSLAGQSSKRGRPKKQNSSIDALHTPDESRPHAGKLSVCNVRPETKELGSKKRSLMKIEKEQNPCRSTLQQPNTGNIANVLTNSCNGNEISGTNPLFHNQIHQDVPGISLCSSELKVNDDKPADSKIVFPIFSHHAKGGEPKGPPPANIVENIGNENFGWTSNIPSEDCGRDLINISSLGYFVNDANVTSKGKNVVVRWSFGNEEPAASVSLQNVVVKSGRDEEMMDDDRSGTEDIL